MVAILSQNLKKQCSNNFKNVKTMKTTKLFFMAALALMTAACSNDDNDKTKQPVKAEGIPFTATISIGESGTTRALSESGSTLVATWAVDDEVALIHNGVKDVMTVASVSAGVATITGTITGSPADGDPVTIIYPATAADGTTGNVKAGLLHAQSGATLDDVASKYDVRKGTGNLKVSGTASLNGNVSLTNQFAIMKLTLANNAKNLSIMADDITIAGATLGTEGTEFYVAVPAVSSKTVTIVANDASNNCYYFSKAGVSLAAGTYYQSSPSMTALGTESSADVYKITATSSVTIPDGKTVVLSGVNISSGSITCNGSVTMILMGANTVSADNYEAAIKIGSSGTTLTITGSGSLTAQGGEDAAGIGTDYRNYGPLSCGNIVINGGTVTATGDYGGAGIGTGRAEGLYGSSPSITCGDITINGGTVIATGSDGGAGIGTGLSYQDGGTASNRCGNITIGTGVTSVTATKGSNSPNSIGKGEAANDGTQTCGTITIGGTIYWDGSDYKNGGETYLTTSPLTYPAAP